MTQILISVFDKFAERPRITDFEDDGWPGHVEVWLQLNEVPKGIVGIGSGIGDESTVGLFLVSREVCIYLH